MSKQSRPKTGSGKLLGTAGYCLFLLSALALGTAGGWVSQSKVLSSIVKNELTHKTPKEVFGASTVTLLILGCDEDLSPGGKRVLKKQARSDMMLIARLDFEHNMVTGVSIPRDTRCKLPGYHVDKINAYHEIARTGQEAELTQRAVEFLLPGIHIDRVVTLDFDHFQELVNMVGGVPMNVEKALRYTDKAGGLYINIKPGQQVLDGYDAMCFVRFRHADSDMERQRRQKEFLLAFKQQALQKWTTAPQLADESVKVLGDALSSDEIASLAMFAKAVPPQNIQWGQIPVKDIPNSYDLRLDEDKLHDVLAQYKLIEAHEAIGGIQ